MSKNKNNPTEIRKVTRGQFNKRVMDASKYRLEKIISKKFQTCFIGALSEFESVFGYMWGHGLNMDVLSEEQIRNREKWEIVRHKILNKGNTQLRSVKEEIELHEIKWNGYITKLDSMENIDENN